MNNKFDLPQLFLRLALGIGFLLPVMDRLGWLGAVGENGNAWGNWNNFVDYTHTLMPYMSNGLTSIISMLATGAEIIFGITLVVGFKTKWSAQGGFLLTLLFALSMLIFVGVREPFTYSVFADSAAALLLSVIPSYRWSVDELKVI